MPIDPRTINAADDDLPAIGAPPPRPRLPKIAVEEHFNYLTAKPGDRAHVDLTSLVKSMDYDQAWSALVGERLSDVGERRIAAMDAGGIDVCILSHTVPGVQGIVDTADAVAAARDINDFLAGRIASHPTRFAGFASIPLQDYLCENFFVSTSGWGRRRTGSTARPSARTIGARSRTSTRGSCSSGLIPES
jgi:hypothetical protein